MTLNPLFGGLALAGVQPHAQARLPIRAASSALGVGMLWGFLPCGLIYSSLAWAATANSAPKAAVLMFAFGLGTLPAMLATSLGATRLQAFLRTRGLKTLIGVMLIASGAWTIYITWSHSGHLAGAAQGESHPPSTDHSHH